MVTDTQVEDLTREQLLALAQVRGIRLPRCICTSTSCATCYGAGLDHNHPRPPQRV
jgi:hypothetical protein